MVSALLATTFSVLTTASQAATPQETLTTCSNLATHVSVPLKATQKGCSSFQAPAIWHMVQPNSAVPTGPGFASIRVCTSKNPQFTYQYIRAECPSYTVSTDYYRVIAPPTTPAIISSSATSDDTVKLYLAQAAASDSPVAYYIVKNLITGVTTQVAPRGLAQLFIPGLSPLTGYSFTITAVSVDGSASNSFTSQVITTAARPVVLATDATLSSLVVTTATISPVFSSSTTSYASTVSNGTTSVAITPTANESHASITVNGTTVTSGTASGAIALSIGANTITTVVTAQNGATKTYSVVITRPGAADTTIAAFSFASPAVTGVVDNTAHTVALTVPYGTSRSALVSTFAIGTGATAKVSTTAQVSGTTANDFTSPVTYTITAEDGVTTQAYTVTVAVAAIQLPAFTLSASSETHKVYTPATGFTVTSTGGTIDSFGISPGVPAGMSFSTSTGAFSGTPTVVAGATTYTVTATNASGSATRTFEFTAAAAGIGDTGPGGGNIFYYLEVGFNCGATYTATGSPTGGLCHYLEVAPSTWFSRPEETRNWASVANQSSDVSGITNEEVANNSSAAIGLGYKNSDLMVAQNDSPSPAANIARNYAGGGKGDWYLPDTAELNLLCQWARGVTQVVTTPCTGGTLANGGFVADRYWASSEYGAGAAWNQNFNDGIQGFGSKTPGNIYFRAVRAF